MTNDQHRKINNSPNQYLEDTGEKLVSSVHYELLVEENEAGIFLLRNDIIEYANPAFSNVVDSDPSQLVGSSILDYIIEAERQELTTIIQHMREGQLKSFSQDFLLNTVDGKIKYFSLHLKVAKYNPQAVEIIGASRVATSRVLKSQELKKTKAKYEALYRNMIDGIIIYDYVNEVSLDCNQAALDILGFESRADLIEYNRFQIIPQFSKYFPGKDLHEITLDHGQRVVAGESFFTPGVLTHKSGRDVMANVNVVPTFYKTGEAYIIFHDVTKEILNSKALKSSEKKYREIFENSHEAIIYIDLKTRKPIVCNQNALQLFGVNSFEEFVQSDPIEYYADPFIDGLSSHKHFYGKIKEVCTHGKAVLSFNAKKRTGEAIVIAGILTRDDSDKANPKIIAFLRDISHIHHAQQQLHEKNEELKKYIDSNLQLENFAYLASHDLQTPLRSITSFTQLLEKSLKDKLSSQEREFMAFIVESSKNMKRLISDLLSYSRVNTMECNPIEVNLSILLESILLELSPVIQEKNAKITSCDLPVSIVADRTKIRQVFQNLLTNALKFMPPGLAPNITIIGKEQADHWLFSVKDNGIGIPLEYQEKIFLLFKRLHGNNDYEGTGIGLAMVKKIISQHGGKIWLESTTQEGTTFFFTIAKLSLQA